MARIAWQAVLHRAAEIVLSYGASVTLRQLFYRLVVEALLPNTRSYYQRLSEYTARGRRDGTFPHLLDRTNGIARPRAFNDAADALRWVRYVYRNDRTAGQPWTVYLGVEKAGMSAQLDAWFTDPFGIPHVALGGYASQTLCDAVRDDIEAQDRPAVLLYAGDHDPSGEDIDRDFESRVGVFGKVERVALNADQLVTFGIPRNELDPVVTAKLGDDPRAARFRQRHGYLDQYELDALPPNLLRDLYRNALAQYWDPDAYQDALDHEAAERAALPGSWTETPHD